jgi:hypothetical protein
MKSLTLCLMTLLACGQATAAELSAETLEKLRAEIAAVRSEQDAQIAEIRRRTEERIGAIEATLRASGDVPALASTAVKAAASPFPKLTLTGDFRLRYEGNWSSQTTPARDRGVLRARLGGRYELMDWLTVGARLATGDPDDPNSTDITLSDFADDLSATLDQAYLQVHRGKLDVYGGKIPNPFTRTELVWDGDVNPEGVGGSWSTPLAGGSIARISGLYFLVNEQAAGPDSKMSGVQLGLGSLEWQGWGFDLAAAYYDYELAGIVGADAGDTRTNLLAPGGTQYLSDFNLFDVVGSATYSTANPAWPLKVLGNFVRNSGAATDADTGYSVDFSIGRASQQDDLRFTYGYSVAETDAVLAAFSHDNTSLGTNYRQHTLALDYVAWRNVVLNGSWYHYRLDDVGTGSVEWLDRLRLNFLIQF